jgi:SAM-dependent methyltransferase
VTALPEASAGGQPPTLADAILRLQELADYIVPFALRSACELGVADELRGGPRPVAEVAAAVGADADALHRVLRALAAKGVFAEAEPGRWTLTPLAELLRSDHPLSLRDTFFPLLPADVRAWARFHYTLRTGRPAFDHVHGRSFYDHLAEHSDDARRVDASVRAQNRLVLRTLLSGYDWGSCGTVVDVGGGTGSFLAGLLVRFRALRGVLLDAPHVAERAPAVLAQAGVEERCEVVAGDFFASVPARADTYLLKTILHDWPDDRALQILSAVRAACRPDSRLVVLEALLPPGDAFHLGKLVDLNSLVLAGGPDRDRAELEDLLRLGGFEVVRAVPTTTLAILECRPA